MMPLPWRQLLPALLACLLIQSPSAAAEKALVAVAANFKTIAESLAREFQAASGHQVVLVSGSTGKLYTQITNGAPFHVFLAADSERPARLHAAGISLGPPRTYATGRLGIWIRDSAADEGHAQRLADLRRVALANPSLAPYGSAAMDVVDRLAIRDKLEGRLAYGENVAQAYALIAAGAADGGLIAWSLLKDGDRTTESWLIPADWHAAINQDAVLLKPDNSENAAASAFYNYLFSPAARTLIEARGYSLN